MSRLSLQGVCACHEKGNGTLCGRGVPIGWREELCLDADPENWTDWCGRQANGLRVRLGARVRAGGPSVYPGETERSQANRGFTPPPA
jgi:hypothetical protein